MGASQLLVAFLLGPAHEEADLGQDDGELQLVVLHENEHVLDLVAVEALRTRQGLTTLGRQKQMVAAIVQESATPPLEVLIMLLMSIYEVELDSS